jgi:hypothetical protein
MNPAIRSVACLGILRRVFYAQVVKYPSTGFKFDACGGIPRFVPEQHSPAGIFCSGRQLPGLRQYRFKFDACGGFPRVVLERIHPILGSPTPPHNDAAKEHSPENDGRDYPTRLRAPRVRAAFLSSKNCVSDRFGAGQPGSQSQPADGGERSRSEEPRLLR